MFDLHMKTEYNPNDLEPLCAANGTQCESGPKSYVGTAEYSAAVSDRLVSPPAESVIQLRRHLK